MAARACLLALAFLSLSLQSGGADEPVPVETRPELLLPETHAEFAQAIEQQWDGFFSVPASEQGEHPALGAYGSQLIDLARDDSREDLSFIAADYLVRSGDGERGDKFHEHLLAGFEAILRHHKNNPHLTAVLGRGIGGGGTPEIETEAFYRRLLEESGNPTVRAGAAYALASHLDSLASMKPTINGIIDRISAAGFDVRQLENLRRHLAGRDVDKMRTEAEQLLRVVINEYPDEKASVREPKGWHVLGNRFKLDEDGLSYGERAERLLFAVSHLRVGREAPDIVGRDASGKEFRLSDYRGKVVLLMFSFKGCGPCEGMYPSNRNLLQTFAGEPFVVLGVMASFVEGETVETLQESMSQGKITWRCWWDGHDRKIAARWDIHGWPSPYLIDSRGVVRPCPRGSEAQEEAIAALVKDIEERDGE